VELSNAQAASMVTDETNEVAMVGKHQQQKRRAIFGDITNVSFVNFHFFAVVIISRFFSRALSDSAFVEMHICSINIHRLAWLTTVTVLSL